MFCGFSFIPIKDNDKGHCFNWSNWGDKLFVFSSLWYETFWFQFNVNGYPLILCIEICTVSTVTTSDWSQHWTILIYCQYFRNDTNEMGSFAQNTSFFSVFTGFHLRVTILFVFDSPVVLSLADVTTVLWLPATCFFHLFPSVRRSCWSGRGCSTCRACYLIWPMRPEGNLMQLRDWIQSVWILSGKLQFSHHQHFKRFIFFLHCQNWNLPRGESRISRGRQPNIRPNCPKNCMKTKDNWAKCGGGGGGTHIRFVYVDPQLELLPDKHCCKNGFLLLL